jgi:hypothetical protein
VRSKYEECRWGCFLAGSCLGEGQLKSDLNMVVEYPDKYLDYDPKKTADRYENGGCVNGDVLNSIVKKFFERKS